MKDIRVKDIKRAYEPEVWDLEPTHIKKDAGVEHITIERYDPETDETIIETKMVSAGPNALDLCLEAAPDRPVVYRGQEHKSVKALLDAIGYTYLASVWRRHPAAKAWKHVKAQIQSGIVDPAELDAFIAWKAARSKAIARELGLPDGVGLNHHCVISH